MKMVKKITVIFTIALIAVFIFSCASSGGSGDAQGSKVWSFANPSDDVQGWEVASSEFWNYRGGATLSYDSETFGRGLLRLDLDFTETSAEDWSEPKMKNDFPRAFNMRGVSVFAFDFYYNPSLLNEGTFTPKIFTNNNGILVDVAGVPIEGSVEEFDNGFVKQEVFMFVPRTAGFMTDLRFSVAGNLTNYKGPVFFDNIRFQ